MAKSSFDPQTFLAGSVTGSMDTKRIPVPEGEYTGAIVQLGAREIEIKDQGIRRMLDITWQVDDPDGSVKTITGREKNTVRQSMFLDLTGEGALDLGAGMNVDLGKLREALGQNKGNKPWSFQNLMGQTAKVIVTHRTQKDTEETFAEIRKVMPLS